MGAGSGRRGRLRSAQVGNQNRVGSKQQHRERSGANRAEAAMAQPRCRSVLITGCSRGIGLGLVRGLAAASPSPDLVFATCRYPEKAQVSGEGEPGVPRAG